MPGTSPARSSSDTICRSNPSGDTAEGYLAGSKMQEVLARAPVRFIDRFEHFTWAWYSLPMTTSGLAGILTPKLQPHTFPGLETIGKIVFLWSIVSFLLVTAALVFRFRRWRHTFRASVIHPTEGLYVAGVWLSLSNFLPGLERFAFDSTGPWLATTYNVLFWAYFACVFASALFHYTLLYTLPELRIEDMSPAWDMHSFPILMCANMAAIGAPHLTPAQAVPMLLCGLATAGLGFMISLFMNANYTRRMVQWGFPNPKTRPAMFIAVGPPAFTALGVLGMAKAWPRDYMNFFGPASFTAQQGQEITYQIIQVMALLTAVFVFLIAFWFFCIAVIAMLVARNEQTFSMSWWSFVFPTTGLVIAVIDIGEALQSAAVLWVGSVATALLCVVYLFVFVKFVLAVYYREVMWPGKDEDVYQHERKAKAVLEHLELNHPDSLPGPMQEPV